jgi:hypothetical protein
MIRIEQQHIRTIDRMTVDPLLASQHDHGRRFFIVAFRSR